MTIFIVYAFGQSIEKRLDVFESLQPKERKRSDNVKRGKAVTVKDLKKVSCEMNKIWYCCGCQEKWPRRDKVEWVVCDTCSRVYHITCTELAVEPNENIGDVDFHCVEAL